MCDVKTGFVQDIVVYTESTTDIQHYEGFRVSGSVVITTLDPLLSKEHTLYCMWIIGTAVPPSSSICSPTAQGPVAQSGQTGKGMPTFGCMKMRRGEVEFKENGQQLAVKWHGKRDVPVLSTVQTATMLATGKVDHLMGERKFKIDCVLNYNLKMGALNKADMINSFVECTKKTTKSYKNIFFHLIDTAAVNGHIVHRQLTGEMITKQGIFCNWTFSSRANHIQKLLT